jgi:hypothetical protein
VHKLSYTFVEIKNVYPTLKVVRIVGRVGMIGEYKHSLGQK